MATVTIYGESGLCGNVKSNGGSGAFFSTVVAGINLTASTAPGYPLVGIDQANYDIAEDFFSWDTSSIGADTVNAVTASIYLQTGPTYTGSLTWELRRYDYGAGLTTADWVPGAQWSSKTLCASLAGSAMAVGHNALTSEAAFAGQINRVGDTQCVFGSSQMSGSAWLAMKDQFYTDNVESQDPKLVLETTQILALNFGCGC